MKEQLQAIVTSFLAGIQALAGKPVSLLIFIVLVMALIDLIAGTGAVGATKGGTISYLFGWGKAGLKEVTKVLNKNGYQILTLIVVLMLLRKK